MADQPIAAPVTLSGSDVSNIAGDASLGIIQTQEVRPTDDGEGVKIRTVSAETPAAEPVTPPTTSLGTDAATVASPSPQEPSPSAGAAAALSATPEATSLADEATSHGPLLNPINGNALAGEQAESSLKLAAAEPAALAASSAATQRLEASATPSAALQASATPQAAMAVQLAALQAEAAKNNPAARAALGLEAPAPSVRNLDRAAMPALGYAPGLAADLKAHPAPEKEPVAASRASVANYGPTPRQQSPNRPPAALPTEPAPSAAPRFSLPADAPSPSRSTAPRNNRALSVRPSGPVPAASLGLFNVGALAQKPVPAAARNSLFAAYQPISLAQRTPTFSAALASQGIAPAARPRAGASFVAQQRVAALNSAPAQHAVGAAAPSPRVGRSRRVLGSVLSATAVPANMPTSRQDATATHPKGAPPSLIPASRLGSRNVAALKRPEIEIVRGEGANRAYGLTQALNTPVTAPKETYAKPNTSVSAPDTPIQASRASAGLASQPGRKSRRAALAPGMS